MNWIPALYADKPDEIIPLKEGVHGSKTIPLKHLDVFVDPVGD
jgi:hypothetical protein